MNTQAILDRIKADIKLYRELETSQQHEREIWEAGQRVDAALPALVEALERLNALALAIQNIGVLMEPADVIGLIDDALAPLKDKLP